MSTRSCFGVILAVAALLASVLVAGAPPAGAQDGQSDYAVRETANDVMFSTTGEVLEHIAVTEDYDGQFQPYIVPAAAFSADGFDPDSFFISFGGGYLTGDADNYGCMAAPVLLPDNATVVNLFAYMVDDSASFGGFVDLWRKQNGTTAGAELMATVSTTGDSSGVQIPGDTTVQNDVVSNGFYSYYVTTCVSSSEVRLHGVWIFTEPADDTFTVIGPDAAVRVESTSGVTAPRDLFELINNGAARFVFTDIDTGNRWQFSQNQNGNFSVSRLGSVGPVSGVGGSELLIAKSGRVKMGPGGDVTFDLLANGNLTITGALTENSDLYAKTAVAGLDAGAVLEAVVGLPIAEWSYADDPGVRHVGPMAQDFYAAFGLGASETGIATLDTSGVALASIQALAAQNQTLADQGASLRTQNQVLELWVGSLTVLVAGLMLMMGIGWLRRPETPLPG